ncbi:hypothetical protein [Methanosarcina sp. UBA289]|uniref:hypothetical protein n=1 Tax=Methanosarcina sp. UBA289 TaxID=1915574 RepID=UPI0025E7355F|nr:hypothetical protein [Methanosarcina sp. UBA289]
MAHYLSKGSTGRSIEDLFNVSPKILICLIEEDYRKVKINPTQKMSVKTLICLKEKLVVNPHYYFMYAQISKRPEDRPLVTERLLST